MARTASAEELARLPLELDLDDEQKQLREATRGFLARHYPVADARALLETERRPDPDGWRAAAEMGWVAILAGEELGGLGAGPAEATVVAAELGRAVNWTPFLGNALAVAYLSAGGAAPDTPAGELAARLVAGDSSAAWCGPEPRGERWDAETVRATAVREGEGFRLDGRKRLVADADLAAELVVCAELEGEPACFLVAADAAGVAVREARTLDLTRRFPSVELDGARVGEEALLARGEAAGAALARTLDLGAVLVAADAIGAAELLLEQTVEYALGRVAFERPIGSYQAVKHICADMLLRVEAAQAATRYAALALGAGTPDASRAVAVAASYAAEATAAVAGDALQIHGGIGFTWEHDLHLYLRRIKADEALFGAAPFHRERLAASFL